MNNKLEANTYKSWVETQEKKGLHPTLLMKNAQPIDLDEQIMVGLRCREGIDIYEKAMNFGWSEQQYLLNIKLLENKWQESINEGLLIKDGRRWKLTDPKGIELCNQVLLPMMIWWSSLKEDSVHLPKNEVLQYKVDALESMPS